ncbi:fimbria/pilus outer membrane usher protein [Sinimarinibacterium flocculans]|uniref:fimbria/pilus outer membrane usher protein n=1 Tax=Sinimarinibacterium flocculans TaxID=985250 RepID=UPI0035122B2F
MSNAVQELYLDVVVNQVPTRRVVQVFADEDRRLYAWPSNLHALGIAVDDLPQDRYLGLDAVPGVDFRYDAARQQLHVDARVDRLDLQRRSIDTVGHRRWSADAQAGALLNYDLFAIHDRQGTVSAATALRVFGGTGIFESSGLSQLREQGDSEPYVRLDSNWTRYAPSGLWTLSVGDFVSGALPWTRATRLGGIQLRRDFSLQPGLITYPIPQFLGEAALPSTIELYVDGVRRYDGDVAPGPFELTAPPAVSGTGQARLVITDTLGRSQVLSFDFYNASRLLQRGLSDYSVELGQVRRNYGIDSFDYRDGMAGSASLRHGLRDWLTLEAHAEGADGLAVAGAGALVGLGHWGTLHGAGAYSSGDGDGSLSHLGYNRTAGGFVVDYALQRTHGDYRDLAAVDGRAPPRRAERALVGLGANAGGQWSLSYVRLDRVEEGRSRSLGLSYSVAPLPRLSLFASLNRDLDDDHALGVFAGLSVSLGHRISVGAAAERRDGHERYSAYASRPVPTDGGGGWALRSERADTGNTHQIEAGYRADRVQWRGGLRRDGDRDSVFAGVGGAVVLMERSVFLARSVDDGFALVSTGGVADVPVLLENRQIGRTDAHGHYLLTGLNAWQPNRIAIDPLHLPPQIRFDHEQLSAVPAARAGTVARFGLERTRAALLVLHQADGSAVPLGSRVHHGEAATAVVGYDGQVYLEELQAHNRVDVVRADGSVCTVRFDYADDLHDLPVIGPLRCDD